MVFVRVGRTRVPRLLCALAGMAAGATLAVLGGIAGIIGAFLAGLGLNRLVPKNSELMDRIDFVGTSVFIPAFLVSIGLRIDPVALVDWLPIVMGLVFMVLVGKGLAVLIASIRIIDAATGEVLRETVLDPTRTYHGTGCPPGHKNNRIHENVGPAIPMSQDITWSG